MIRWLVLVTHDGITWVARYSHLRMRAASHLCDAKEDMRLMFSFSTTKNLTVLGFRVYRSYNCNTSNQH